MTTARTNLLPIPQLQGSGSLSPYENKPVATSGIITALNTSKKSPGFFLQDPKGDDNAATSDALFVSTLHVPDEERSKFAVGRSVQVKGTMREDPNHLTTIEAIADGIKAMRGTRRANAAGLPAPTPLALPDSMSGKLGYLEAREGMLATVDDALVIGASSKYGNYTVVDSKTSPMRHFDDRKEGQRLLISGRIGPGTQMGVGDRVAGISGPVTQVKGGDFELWQSKQYAEVTRGQVPAKRWGDLDFDDRIGASDIAAIKARVGEPATGPVDPADLNGDGKVSRADVTQATKRMERVTGEPTYRVANLNIENFFDDVDAPPPVDDDVLSPNQYNAKLARVAGAIRDGLGQPDILAMQEVEGPQVLADLIARPELRDLGYKFAVLPTNGHRSINPAVLYRGDRVSLDNLRQVQQEVTAEAAPKGMHMTASDGTTLQSKPLFAREPLLADVTVNKDGRTDNFTLVVNHLISKFSPQGLPTEPIRTAQAKFLNNMVQEMRSTTPDREVVVVGDLNDTPGSKPLRALTGPAKDPTLVNASATLVPQGERYSYNYKGKSELIDHVLYTPGFDERVEAAGVRHVNSDLTNGMTWGAGPHGSSDHDSPWIDVRLPASVAQAAGGAAQLTPAPAAESASDASA